MTETEAAEIAPGITGTIDFDELVHLIRLEMTEEGSHGKFIYETPAGHDGCVNVIKNSSGDWEPSCLIGRVLWNSGKIDRQLLIDHPGGSANHDAIRRVWANEKTRQLAVNVQWRQDDHYQWGHALNLTLISLGYYTKNEEFSNV